MAKVFVAYASQPAGIGETIEQTKVLAKTSIHDIDLETWRREDLGGQQLERPILDSIHAADIVVCDVTVINFNVTYELGYAIGLGKRVIPVRHRAFDLEHAEIQRIGIFDTLLRQEYSDAEELFDLITAAQPGQRVATNFPMDPLPLYIVLPEIKGDDWGQLVGRARRAGVKARTFDPAEQPRLGAVEAVRSVAASYGIVAPLLPSEVKEAHVHNTRAAFVAGVANALGRPALLIQRGAWETPLDVRDSVSSFNNDNQFTVLFGSFAERVHDARYSVAKPAATKVTRLSALNLGDPAAENEESQLEAYFLDRAEYRQVLEGRVNIVVGRKGSGKTAVYVRARDQLKEDRSRIVVDLSPQSHQLRKLKDLVLECLSAGSKEYLLSAFWEYVLLLEICNKILEKDIDVHKRNHTLFEPYQRLLKFFREDPVSLALDFSDRLSILIERVSDRYQAAFGGREGVVLSQGNLTKLLHETTLSSLRGEIEKYALNKDGIFLLFDNIDKGWNADGLEDADIVMVRTLLDAARKLQNDFRRAGTDFHGVVFLRNDIYDLLISSTPDRGKETRILVDWLQPDLLKQMVKRRLLYNVHDKSLTVDAAWHQISVAVVHGQNSLDFLIGRSLMRPRYVLRLINHCVGNAINFERERVDEDDIEYGLSAYSTDVITEIDLEIRDVLGGSGDVLYRFLGEPREMKISTIKTLLAVKAADEAQVEGVFNLLLWHGVVGLRRGRDEATYIYDVNYDLRRLRGLIEKAHGGDPIMQMNPAFWPGLELTE